jgi:amino acid transporter
MSEEVKDASRYVPIAIIWGYIVNGLLGLVIVIIYLFSIPSLNDALNDPSGFPFIYVFQNCVSTAGVNGLTASILIPVIFSNILFNMSTARQTYAFARDKGFPFGSWLARVDPKRKIPINAIAFSCLISVLLSLINIGSDTAFNAIISLNVAALMSTYAVSISCVLYASIWHPGRLPEKRWSLGRFSVPVNMIGLCYVIFALFWSFWPPSPGFDPSEFNWSVVIFGGVLIISLVMYSMHGRYHYSGPVEYVSRTSVDRRLL